MDGHATVSISVMDAFTLDAAVAAGCLMIGVAVRSRKPRIRRAAAPRMITVRSVRGLRRRHRRVSRAIIKLAHECLERHPEGSFEAFTAAETLRSYLPDTLAAYVAVPRALRREVRAGRPSADDELARQLQTLYGGLAVIVQTDAEAGATRMAANGAFLHERFGPMELTRATSRPSAFTEFVDGIQTALRRP